MSPRVIPREERELNYMGTLRVGGDTAAQLAEAELDRRYVQEQAHLQRLKCTRQNPYVDGCSHSYFRDLLAVRAAEVYEQSRREAGLVGQSAGFPDARTLDEAVEARARLAAASEWSKYDVRRLAKQPEPTARQWVARRDLSSAAGAGGEFVPSSGGPVYLAEEFAVAARGRATLADALPSRPLPDVGLKMEVPRLTGGAAAAVHVDNTAVQEVDPTTGLASSALSEIAGQVDMSRQVFEKSTPGFDRVLAAELGRALGERIDLELIAGTNTTGRTQGLASVSGTIAVAYTDATPTPAELVSKIWEAHRQIAEQGGGPPEAGPDSYLVVMAPRRLAWLQAGYSVDVTDLLPGRVVTTIGARLTLGAGTNEDEVYVIARNEVFIGQERPQIRVFEEVGSATLTVRVSAIAMVCAMFARQPKAIARVSGTGLVNPGVIGG